MTPEEETATRALVGVLDGYLCDDIGPKLSCTEVDVFATFLRAHGEDGNADILIDSHATDDDSGDSHWDRRAKCVECDMPLDPDGYCTEVGCARCGKTGGAE